MDGLAEGGTDWRAGGKVSGKGRPREEAWEGDRKATWVPGAEIWSRETEPGAELGGGAGGAT